MQVNILQAIIISISSVICVADLGLSALGLGAAIVAGGLYGVKDAAYCRFGWSECCSDDWIKFNHSGLEWDFSSKLFGQPFVEKEVPRILNGFLSSQKPRKALALAFHGHTGGGKNYASSIIARNLYKKGMDSEFVHFYSGPQDFSHQGQMVQYKEKIKNDIKESTKRCGRSLFIFDEVDKMAEGILDAVKPFLDFFDHMEGVDYRRNIFIFLSNAGGGSINKIALNHHNNGLKRENMKLKDVETSISKAAFHTTGGLKNSEIISKNMIDIFIPFLPLEKNHIKLCIRNEFRDQSRFDVEEYIIDEIADELEYAPDDLLIYSTSGCKRIAGRVARYL